MQIREKAIRSSNFWQNEVFITMARWLTIIGMPILLWFYRQEFYYSLVIVSLIFIVYNGVLQYYLFKGIDPRKYAVLLSVVDSIYLTYIYINTLYITQSGLPQLYYFLMLVMGLRHGIARYPWVVGVSLLLYIWTTLSSSYIFRFKIYSFNLLAQIVFFSAFGIISSYFLKREHQQHLEKEDLISELQVAYQQLCIHNAQVEALANTDPLTGLYNYRFFTEQFKMELELSRRFDSPMSLIILDIDHFKKLNDTYGHPAGDIVLKESAEIFKLNIRDNDILCRYGGEEFMILLPSTGIQEAFKCAERIRRAIQNHKIFLPDYVQPISITVSGGVACYPTDARDGEQLIQVADNVLYTAKNKGRNKIVTKEDFSLNKKYVP